jgi:hypothetical protein
MRTGLFLLIITSFPAECWGSASAYNRGLTLGQRMTLVPCAKKPVRWVTPNTDPACVVCHTLAYPHIELDPSPQALVEPWP